MSVPDIQSALELLRQREVDAAISSLTQKVEEIPAHLTAHVLLARAHEAKRDWSMALKSWENAHFLMPNSPIVKAGKERVIERINEEESAPPPAPTSPSPGSPANRGDASPSQEPPEPKASPSSPEPSSEDTGADRSSTKAPSPPSSAPEGRASKEATQPEAAQPEADDPKPAAAESGQAESEETESEGARTQSPGGPSSVAQQAQALLGNRTADTGPAPSEGSDTAESTAEESDPADPTPGAETAKAGTANVTAADDVDRGGATRTPDTDASTDSPSPSSEAIRQIAEEFASTSDEEDASSAEISTSRRPDTTSYRPDTAIIDAAASLLSQGPTPSAKSAESDPSGAEEPDTAPKNREASPETGAGSDTASPDAGVEEETQDDKGTANPMSADSFIPDFAARSTSSEEPEQEATPTGRTSAGGSDAKDADTSGRSEPEREAPATRQPSYDTSEMPESRLLDKLGPPPEAGTSSQAAERNEPTPTDKTSIFQSSGSGTPTLELGERSFQKPPFSNREHRAEDQPDEESGFGTRKDKTTGTSPAEPSEPDERAAGSGTRPRRSSSDIPNPADFFPSDAPAQKSHEGPASPDTHSDAADASADSEEPEEELSPLDRLRRSAEQEARRGGARPDMQKQVDELSPGSQDADQPDDTVGDLDRLIQDLESARIQPRPDLDDLPTPDLEDNVEDLVSETLARIYAAQSQYREAARIYVKLASQEPANARDHLENAADMRRKAEQKEAEERAAEASNEE